MAGRAQIATKSSALIAMIADEFGVVLLCWATNVCDSSKFLISSGYALIRSCSCDFWPWVMCHIVTQTSLTKRETTVKAIEDAFKEFTTKEDIAIVLISQYVANMIRFLVDSYNKPIPAILEIPSKDHPYDPAHDSVLSRVKNLFSAESVASGRR
ncbi:V-type proton ATPase subunit F [Citrus sinensis]|nr:V-type proton ATPase subunit F [Citrus sinensis]